MRFNWVIVFCSMVLLSGCTVRLADLTVASTKNYDLNAGNFIRGERITGEDSYPVFIFPLGQPNIKTAMDRAIQKHRCAVGLSDMVVTQLNHAFIFGKSGILVEGNLILSRNQPGC